MRLRCRNPKCESRIDENIEPCFDVFMCVDKEGNLVEAVHEMMLNEFICCFCNDRAEESPKQSEIKSESRVKFEGSERYQVKIDGDVAGYVSREDSYGHFEGDLEYNHTDGCTYLCQIQSAETLDEVRRQLEEIIYGDFEDL